MKNCLIVSTLIFLTLFACTTPSIVDRPATITFYGIDFSKYTEQGFLITPYEFNGEYESIGILTAKSCPEVIVKNVKKSERTYDNTKPYSYYINKKIDAEKNQNRTIVANRKTAQGDSYYLGEVELSETIDKLVERAKSMGADAIIDFKNSSTSLINVRTGIPCIQVSGFAIKRK